MKAQAKALLPPQPPLPPDPQDGRLPVKPPLPPSNRLLVEFTPEAMGLIACAAREAEETPEEFIRSAVCGYVCMYLADSTRQQCTGIAAAFGFSEEEA